MLIIKIIIVTELLEIVLCVVLFFFDFLEIVLNY